MRNNISHDKTLTGKIKTATIVLLFLISVSTLTSVVHAQSNPSLSVQSQKVRSSDSSSSSNTVGSNKSFYLYTGEIEGINETKLGMPADYYIPNIFVANKGDTITVHFYNLDADDKHSFTIGTPYNINQNVAPLHNATFTFKAGNEGVYRFYCTYHQPTMTGQLIVLPASTELTAATYRK
ncbi:MAG TPA: cupredoxin domain-containing protein [Candidatus Bathyarchaeia archaeon]|nr:cupredoxin domain-containing protein [Candidatus Bathyarchaeia archaeon]